MTRLLFFKTPVAKSIFLFILGGCLLGCPALIFAQQPSSAAYEHALHFMRDSLYAHTYHLNVSPLWFKNNKGFAYKAHTQKGDRYFKVKYDQLKPVFMFTQKALIKSMEIAEDTSIRAEDFKISKLIWQHDKKFQFDWNGTTYHGQLKNHQPYIIEREKHKENAKKSPDGAYSVFLKNRNLFLRNLKNGKVHPLSSDGKPYYIYGSYYGWAQTMKGENTPPKPNFTAQWSPDSKKILTQIMDARKAKKLYLLNWSIDSLYRPVLLSYYRALPGDTNVMTYQPVVFNRTTQKMTTLDIPPVPQFIDIQLKWSADSRHLYGLYYHRGYKTMDFIEVDPKTGAVRKLFTDHSKTSIDYKVQVRYLAQQGIAFITSERSGWNQLYRIDLKSTTVRPVTQGKFVVKDILGIDKEKKLIYFTASGKIEGVNPYHNFLYKVDFNGDDLQLLTPEPVNHQVYLSPDYTYFVDNSSTVTQPTISYLRSTHNGEKLLKISEADISVLKALGFKPPQLFTATARDGETTLYGAIWKPTHFDPKNTYPIIDYTYTGPHTHIVPNSFSEVIWPYAYGDIQALAELGFVIVQIDGLGTYGRSDDFQAWSYQNMTNNLKDHTLAIAQLGARYSWIDTSRVGIFGHSAGGYDAAHALMVFPDTYDVAVSESADHDWRMEKAYWPEMYAGWPVGAYYDKQSNITLAPQLEGDLLLIHGGIDANVNPSATFKLAEALIKAGKYFDMLIVPSGHHSFPESYKIYLAKKRWQFFVEHLLIAPTN